MCKRLLRKDFSPTERVTVFEEEGNCIVCLEMRADELMRRLIWSELTNYGVVRTSPESLHYQTLKFLPDSDEKE
jgi:hypothetical protein